MGGFEEMYLTCQAMRARIIDVMHRSSIGVYGVMAVECVFLCVLQALVVC